MRSPTLVCLVLATALFQNIALGKEKKLMGVASYSELGKEVYIGGIYANKDSRPASPQDLPELVNRIEFRITAQRFSKSAFITHLWSWTHYSNPDFSDSETSKSINELSSKIKTPLYQGDSIAIEVSKAVNSIVFINNIVVLKVPGDELFNNIRNSWLGNNIPKHSFKSSLLLGINRSDVGRYSRLHVDGKRIQEIASWVQPIAKAKKKTRNRSSMKNKIVRKKVVQNNPALVAAMTPPAPGPEIIKQRKEEEEQRKRIAEEKRKLVAQEHWRHYISSVVKPIYEKIEYPQLAYRKNIQGKVTLDVQIDKQGQLIGVDIKEKSGSDVLDRAALSAINASTPWPSPPDTTDFYYQNTNGHYLINIPINFVLNR